MKNFFICDFFDFSRKFFKAFIAFFVLFFLNFSVFAEDEDVYYRWTPYGAEWNGSWSETYKDGDKSKAKFWSYWKKSEPNWEKTFNNTGGTADYPGYYPDPNQKKLAYTYFTGEHAVTAKLDSSPANELEELHIGDCYNSQAAGSSVGTEKITINLSGADLKAKTLVLGSSSADVPSVDFALTGGGTLKVSGKMSFAAAPGVSCTYNIEVGTGTVLDVSSIELNDSRATVTFTGEGTLKAGNAIFSTGKININVKNLEISGTFKNEAGATLSVSGLSSDSRKFVGDFENAGTAEFSGGSKNTFGGAVTNSGSAKFKDSAEGIFNGTVKNSGRLGFSGTAKGTFNGAVTNATRGIFGFSGSAEGTFSRTVKNSGIFGFSDSAEGTFNGTVKNSGTLGFSDTAGGTFAQDFTNNTGGAVSFSNTAKGTFSGEVTNATGGTIGFSSSAEGTFSSAFSNSGTVDLENASSQIKFDGSFTNNQDGTVTLPDAAGASVTFGTGTGTDSFSNLGTVNSSGLCAVTFANQPVKDDGTWVYTGGTTSGKVILAGDISYNVLILKGNLEVPGDLTATKILVETNSLKIQGKITSDSIDVKTEKPIELTGKLTVGSAAFRLSKNTNFKINNYELVFGTDAKKCAITSGAAKKLSFFGTAGSKINFHSASFGQGTSSIGDFNSGPDVLFNCDVHAKSLTAKKDAEIHAAEINTTGKQEYYGAVTVSSAVTVSGAAKTKFNASAVNFRGTTDIQNETEVSAAGAVAFSGNLTVAAASPLVVSASEATFSGAVRTSAKTGITARSGAVRFEKPIEAGDEFSVKADSTGGSVTFADTVKFSGKTSISASAGQVCFVSTLETSSGVQVSVVSHSAVFEKTLTLKDGLSVNADLTAGSAEFKEAVDSTSKIEVSAKTARFNSSVSAGDSVSVENAETAVFASALSAGSFISVKSGVSTFTSSVTAAKSISVEGTEATFSGDVKVSAGSASILADTVFSGDCNISVSPGPFSIGNPTSSKNTVVETGKNVKFKDISDGNFYGKFNNSGKVSFENCRNIKIWGDSLNSGDFLCSGISDFEISGTFKNEAGATLSVSGLSSESRKFVGAFENAGTAEFSGESKSSFGGAVTNSGSAKFKDSAEGTFNGTVKNSGTLDFSDTAGGTFAQDFTNDTGGAVSFAGTAKGTFSGAVTNAAGGTFDFSGSAIGTFDGTVENSGTLGFSDTATGTFAQDFTNNTGGTVSFSNTAKGTFSGAVTNTTGGTFGFAGSAEGTFSGEVTNATGGTFAFSGSAAGTFSSAFLNSGVVDLKNASSHIKFDGNFTNNKDGTVTLPDAAGASVTFGTGTGTDSFSNSGTVNSSGLCSVAFANSPVADGGTWIYTGGAKTGQVILSDISYNILILKGNLKVAGNLTAKDIIIVETDSLKIEGEISSGSIDVKTEKPIELKGKLTVDSLAFTLSENTNFQINNHELVFGTNGRECKITSGSVPAKNLSFFGTAGSKIDFYSASFGQGADIIGDFNSGPDVLFNCDVHAKSLTAKNAEIHAAEINTSEKQEYSGAVTVSGAAKTKFNASAVTFRGTTDIQNETEVSATGAVAFSGNLTVAANSPLAVSASAATFSGAVTTFSKTGITARSGAVRFEKPIEAGDEFSVKADSTGGSVTFSDTVKFSGKTSLSSSSGQVHFGSTLETFPGAQVSVVSRSAVFEKTLTLKDGLSVNADSTGGSVTFASTVVSTSKIEVSAKTASFNSAVSAEDSISVQNAETAAFASALSAGTFISVKSGVSTFASSVTAAKSMSVEGAEATFSGDVKVSAGALSVIAEKSFFRSDVNVSGKVDISGTAASVQFDSDFISSGISVFDADVYFSAKRKNDVEIRTEKMYVGSENSEKNLYISAVDDAAASAKNISWRTPADVSGNFVLLNGNIKLSNNPSGKTPDISAGKDIVLLNGDSSSMYNDSVSADFNWRSDAEGIFKYSGRENSNAVFPDAFPDGTQISSEKFISSLSGLGNGVTLSAGKNFYCNGVNLEGDSAWNLKAGNNENSENFAEAYASSIKNCNFYSSGNGISFLSAAESVDKGGNNEKVCFGHPEIDFARTVYDDVIEVSFKDSFSKLAVKKPVKIENSNNEIWKNIAENSTFLTYGNNGSKISFTGTFVDAECTESTDGKGDLEKFFIKAPESWNTDATGKSPGAAQSTDMNGIHRSAVPYLNIVRAVSGNLQGLRDEHKNRIASYDGAAKRFDGVKDSCPPVLLAVRTGQELHEKLPEKQKTHDSHNFLEFQYSEEIFVNGGDSSVVNVQSSAELAGISNSSESGILVSGLAQFEIGKVSLGSESGIAPEKLNSIYRNFAVSLSKGESPQTHRFRISLAGYQSQTAAENPSGFPYWPGYIDSDNTQMPSGRITLLPHGNQPSAENQKFNDFIKDSEGNSLLVKSQKNHSLKKLSVISDSSGDIYNPDRNDSVYGTWDLSAPVFAVYRSFNSNGAAKSSEFCEILGACKTSGTFLDRIEFHVFDNSELDFGGAEWFSQFGWGKDKNTLFAEDSYASDIFGGSRPFGNSPGGSARTSGGIRYSTLYNKSSYFNYGVDYETPASEFKNSRIESGAFSTLFLSKIGDKREISSGDSLYFSVFLKDGTKLPLKTNFSVRYDQQGCVTDLAGNLMKSAEAKSVDRVSPRFNMTSAKVSGNKLYVVFNKEINLEPVELEFSDGTKKSFGISDSLRFIKIPADGHKFEDSDVVSDLYIEKETAPLKIYSSSTFTGLIFTLNRNVTLEDVKNYYIQSFSPKSGKFIDPFTGIKDVKVTAITDVNGNYMSHGDAHALSDFAVDVVNPVYAYDDRFMEEKFGFSASAAAQSNLSVREWDEDQQKDGTLLTEHNLFVVTSQDSGNSEDAESLPEKIIMYYDKSPDSDSVSKEYNKNLEQNLRVWIPSLVPVDTSGSSTERIYSLTALASATNSNNLFAVGEVSKNIAKFTLDWETMEKNGYSSGNQVSFLFGLAEPDGSPVKICHAPSYDEITGVYRLEPQPLFALRLKNSNDPVSLDLWSFRLKSAVLQRGNVTIFNNVIDVNKGEMSVVRVNMPSEGRLDVIVMTLDGNIIRYLQHGTASAGEHNYSWNGTSKSGKKVARGLYFVRVFGNGIDETRKIMVVKN